MSSVTNQSFKDTKAICVVCCWKGMLFVFDVKANNLEFKRLTIIVKHQWKRTKTFNQDPLLQFAGVFDFARGLADRHRAEQHIPFFLPPPGGYAVVS